MTFKTLLMAMLLSIPKIDLTAQSLSKLPSEKCKDCKIECLCDHFLGKYRQDTDQTRVNVIKNNWTDFFGEDLDAELPAPQQVTTISIKFDGMGCIYPKHSPLLRGIKNDFLDSKVKFTKFHQSTFYHIFNKNSGQQGATAAKTFIKATLPETKFDMDGKDIDYFDFVKKWNAKFVKEKVTEINTKLLNKQIKKIIFYIHGFNVPYGLAHIQGNVLLDSVLSLNKSLKPENILLLRVFWPSGDYKNKDISPGSCDYDNFENLKTVRAFTYFSNRTYMGGIYLRRILAGLSPTELPMEIITHSHGATMAATSLVNTKKKMQKGEITNKIKELMSKEPLPPKKIDLFLNAPSIPGINTFKDLKENSEQKNYRFFVGYNNDDKVLAKQKFKIWKLKVPFIKPARYLSSTSLGCNRKKEVYETQQVFTKKGMEDNFSSGVNSFQDQHDFFCYMMQIEFRRNLKLFLLNHLFTPLD